MAKTAASSFYITLPSNSSQGDYPENTLAHFKVKLPYTVLLEGEWEVGLVEMHYPHRWYNYHNSYQHSRILYSSNGGESWDEHRIPNGHYGDVRSLLSEIVPREMRRAIEFDYNSLSDSVSLITHDPSYRVKFMGGIASMLGFPDGKVLMGPVKASMPTDLMMIHGLYVYSDIVEHQIVGDTRAPLLRVVPIKEKQGKDVTANFEVPHYLPVSKKLFDVMEIDIRDATGQRIPFQRGRVVVKLHLRKSAPSLLR